MLYSGEIYTAGSDVRDKSLNISYMISVMNIADGQD